MMIAEVEVACFPLIEKSRPLELTANKLEAKLIKKYMLQLENLKQEQHS